MPCVTLNKSNRGDNKERQNCFLSDFNFFASSNSTIYSTCTIWYYMRYGRLFSVYMHSHARMQVLILCKYGIVGIYARMAYISVLYAFIEKTYDYMRR